MKNINKEIRQQVLERMHQDPRFINESGLFVGANRIIAYNHIAINHPDMIDDEETMYQLMVDNYKL